MSDDNAVARLFYELGQLKRTPRTGWFYAGVGKSEVESVAEHSFRTAIVAYVLAALDGADPERTSILALFHDTQESRTSDIAYIGKQYLSRPDHEQVTADQTESLPDSVRDPIRGRVTEYETQNSREAVLARDADKLECLLQAREYQLHGQGEPSGWITSSIAELQTDLAKRLAETIVAMPANDWWRAVLEATDST